jgi:outer membrane protein TolC
MAGSADRQLVAHAARPRLNRLIKRAMVANPDIEAALDRVQQAREHEIVVLGATLPQLGTAAGIGTGTDSVEPSRIPDSFSNELHEP